jgi:uncharacterized protein (TIGR02266 family)
MNADSDGSERRNHPRTHLTLKVEYPSVEGFLQDYTINISQGGTMLRTRRRLVEGDNVDLVLSFPGLLEPIKLCGIVRWLRSDGLHDKTVGVAFDEAGALDPLIPLVNKLREGDPEVMAPTVRLLVVEDNPHVARLIQEGMNAYQQRSKDLTTFQIQHVTNGKEALDLLKAEPFDLLIVDIYLPVMDGETLISTLRGDPRWENLPTIAVSAGAQEAKLRALRAGADFFLDKPFRLSDILYTMRRLVTSLREGQS